MKKCPRCGHKRFVVSAHIVQEWVVDENESFEEVFNDCSCVTHNPDDDDIWECYFCGFESAGREFNVEE